MTYVQILILQKNHKNVWIVTKGSKKRRSNALKLPLFHSQLLGCHFSDCQVYSTV
jgi:hypothetical protein